MADDETSKPTDVASSETFVFEHSLSPLLIAPLVEGEASKPTDEASRDSSMFEHSFSSFASLGSFVISHFRWSLELEAPPMSFSVEGSFPSISPICMTSMTQPTSHGEPLDPLDPLENTASPIENVPPNLQPPSTPLVTKTDNTKSDMKPISTPRKKNSPVPKAWIDLYRARPYSQDSPNTLKVWLHTGVFTHIRQGARPVPKNSSKKRGRPTTAKKTTPAKKTTTPMKTRSFKTPAHKRHRRI